MKNKFLIVLCLIFAGFFATSNVAGQVRIARIYQSCPNSILRAEVKIQNGDIFLIPCPTKKVYYNTTEVGVTGGGGSGGVTSVNTRTGAVVLTLTDVGLSAAGTVNQYLAGNGSYKTIIDKEIPTGAINGTNTNFTLAFTPLAGSEHVYLNGVLQTIGSGNDYTLSGAVVTMTTAPLTGERLIVSYRK